MKAVTNLYAYVKKHGWKKARKDWYYNFVMLETPEQSLKKQIIGYAGGAVGLILAGIVLVYRGVWYFAIPTFFFVIIQYTMLKNVLKQKQTLKDMKEQFEGEE